MLYIVASPIGNLSDISKRALDVLSSVDLIAAEDTRVSKKLLSAYNINTRLMSLHKFNEREKSKVVIDKILNEGLNIAYISDAGTPCISDPGALLVSLAWQNNIQVVPVPGASAVVSALSISGFLESEFSFFGFLPRQKKELREKLSDIAKRSKLAVIYESPHRVIELVAEIESLFPECELLISCDLTKLYELNLRGSPSELLERLRANPKTEKGEYCLVIHFLNVNSEEEKEEEISLEALLFDRVIKGESVKEAISGLSQRGYKKNALYEASINLKNHLR